MDAAAAKMPHSCWILTDGKTGMEIQCLGLAEALGLEPVVKRVQITKPWRWMPATWIRDPLSTLGSKGDHLAPPWPDLLIASGRQAVAPALAVREKSAGATFLVQIQNPAVDPSRFDLVVVPEHDRLEGPNVITSKGALGRITPDRLAAAAAEFAPRYDHLPHPRIAVLVGGDSKVFRMTAGIARDLAAGLARLCKEQGAGLMITPSRRTGPRNEAILRQALAGLPAEIWNGEGTNPYFGLLGLADAVVVTGDSVNMVSEAAGTGKPVFVVDLKGRSTKFARFHQSLREAGITRPFNGRLETWDYPRLAETERIAAAIRARLATRA